MFSKLADDLLTSGYVDLCLFLSIVFLILFTRLLGFPDTFSTALFSTISTPVMYSIAYYYRKPATGYFVKPKNHRVVRFRAAYRSLVATLTSFAIGFIVFAALSGSTNIAVYTVAFLVTWLQRTALYYMLSAVAEHIDIESPIAHVVVSALTALMALVVLLAVVAMLRL